LPRSRVCHLGSSFHSMHLLQPLCPKCAPFPDISALTSYAVCKSIVICHCGWHCPLLAQFISPGSLSQPFQGCFTFLPFFNIFFQTQCMPRLLHPPQSLYAQTHSTLEFKSKPAFLQITPVVPVVSILLGGFLTGMRLKFSCVVSQVHHAQEPFATKCQNPRIF